MQVPFPTPDGDDVLPVPQDHAGTGPGRCLPRCDRAGQHQRRPDGNWYDPANSGSGVPIDVLRSRRQRAAVRRDADYDSAGKPIWYTFLGDLAKGENVVEDVAVNLFEKGSSAATIGTVAIDVSSCSAIGLTFDFDEASGLADASHDVSPGQVNIGGAANALCNEAPVLSSCPTGTTAEGADCLLPNNIERRAVPAGGQEVSGQGRGDREEGATLTIDPGVTVQGHED